MNQALILIDYQKEWTDKNSDYYVGDLKNLIQKVNQLIEHCRQKGCKIIFTQHIEPEGEGAFAQGSANAELIGELDKQNSDTIITKNKISPFYQTGLAKELEDIESVTVCGILTNLCVRSFIHDAYDRDFNITVIQDCCVALDKETQNFTFKDLKETREEIEFMDSDKFIQS